MNIKKVGIEPLGNAVYNIILACLLCLLVVKINFDYML